MGSTLYLFLLEFMIQNNWQYKNVPEQARAIFTTICLMENLEADTAEPDKILLEVFNRSAMDEHLGFESFKNFMYSHMV